MTAACRDLFDEANPAGHQTVEKIHYSGNSLIQIVTERIRRAATEIWPRPKTAQHLSLVGDLTVTQAYRVMSREQGFSGAVLIHLLRSEYGFRFLSAIMEGARVQWWREVGQERELTAIKQQRRALDRKLKQIEET